MRRAFTTDDIGKRHQGAVNRLANAIPATRWDLFLAGEDDDENAVAYSEAAYGGPGNKAAFAGYAAQVAATIRIFWNNGRVAWFGNQGKREETDNPLGLEQWLDSDRTGWVHCFSHFVPSPSAYRVYVCARLDQTPTILRQILQTYNGHLYFKVAAHSEAQRRNDTIVSWHSDFQEARSWAELARANEGLLQGEAPAGTFGVSRSVAIDTNTPGDTSTHRLARAALERINKRNFREI
jgi:hypothetical protein